MLRAEGVRERRDRIGVRIRDSEWGAGGDAGVCSKLNGGITPKALVVRDA